MTFKNLLKWWHKRRAHYHDMRIPEKNSLYERTFPDSAIAHEGNRHYHTKWRDYHREEMRKLEI